MSQKILELIKITKRYSSQFTLGPVSYELAADDILGILGANGAGKSTLMETITGNSDLTTGEVWFLEQKLTPENTQLKKRIGYLPQDLKLPPWLTSREILNYAFTLLGLPKSERKNILTEHAKYWDCESYLDKPFTACSYGMQKRVGLCLATLKKPELLILDEPFSGLDITHVFILEDHIIQRKNQGQPTIFSSHIPVNVAKLCNKVVILESGSITPVLTWENQTYVDRIEFIDQHFRSLVKTTK